MFSQLSESSLLVEIRKKEEARGKKQEGKSKKEVSLELTCYSDFLPTNRDDLGEDI